jgi:hypothetical protein
LENLSLFLKTLLYKSVTVYISTFSIKSIWFTGVLSNVSNNCITIILTIGTTNYRNKPKKTYINFNRHFQPSDILINPGQNVIIPIDKIDAIVYYPV